MNILTIDLEDWFHILDHPETASPDSWASMESRIEKNAERILDLLEERNLSATWFCLGWVAKRYPALIKRISERHELACHSIHHTLLYKQSKDEAKKDILGNTRLLEDLSGKKVNAYRSPGFSFTEKTKWLVNVLEEAGIRYDCSVFPIKRNHGGYPGFPVAGPCRISYNGSEIMEFPMNTASVAGRRIVFSGGGYFRVLPYPLITRLMRKSDYVMTYFHPRDFDNYQPVLETLSLKRKLMTYAGLGTAFNKFGKLLAEHKFVSVEEAGRSIDWNNCPVVKI